MQIDFPAPPNPAALPDATCYTIELFGSVRTASGADLVGDSNLSIRALAGDTTGNGTVNLGDALYIKRCIGTINAWEAPWLDFNVDGTLDNADVLACKQRVTSPAAQALCP